MVVEILLVVVVLAVAVLTAVDMAKTPSESPHGQAVRQAHDAGRAFAGVSRGTGVTEANREHGAPGILSAPPDATAARLPESVAPAAGSREPGRVGAHAERNADHRRLPIFDEMESRWFAAGLTAPGRTGPGSGWTSPADTGWQAAQAAELPTSSGSTPEGLPRRTPAANLIPGAIPGTPPSAAPTRSAAEIRDRLTGFHRGISEGRAAAGEGRAAVGESTDQATDNQA